MKKEVEKKKKITASHNFMCEQAPETAQPRILHTYLYGSYKYMAINSSFHTRYMCVGCCVHISYNSLCDFDA